MAVQHYRELIAWQKAMELVRLVYAVSRRFPDEERFGLVNQIRRAAVSVPSNIAEDQGRGATKDFMHFLRMANGSRQEVETQLLLGVMLGFVTDKEIDPAMAAAAETGRLMAGLTRSIEEQLATGN